MEDVKIAYCKIFPSIGIARVGDSVDREGYFVGPEFPDSLPHKQPNFTFRDSTGRIKRQAARFRVYAFDDQGNPIKEITEEEAEIVWEVSLANKKAAWFAFEGTEKALAAYRGETTSLPNKRNSTLGELKLETSNGNPRYVSDEDRAKILEIHGGVRKISGKLKQTIYNDKNEQYEIIGTFKERVQVELGEIRTDEKGRLLVLGGKGKSDAIDENGKSIKDLRWIRNYANNNDWYDDVSDGPVTAQVTLKGTNDLIKVIGGAWVIVAPPDYAPDVANLVTLFDTMEEVAYFNPQLVKHDTPKPRTPHNLYFDTDIAPIFERLHNYRWVNERGLRGHGFKKPGDFQKVGEGNALMEELYKKDSPTGKLLRQKIFDLIRQPTYQKGPEDATYKERMNSSYAISQATYLYMPPLAGDQGDPTPGDPSTWFSLTYLQYERMKGWKNEDYEIGADLTLVKKDGDPLSRLTYEIETLTKTALNSCAGGAFYPGIEMTCIAREPSIYSEAFRLNHENLSAGDITKYMALPWQADFYECQQDWWPAQRPDDIVTDEEFDKLLKQFTEEVSGDFKQQFDQVLFNRKRWDRNIGVKSRPSVRYLRSRLFPDPHKNETTEAYIDRILSKDTPRDPLYDSITNYIVPRIAPAINLKDWATDPWPVGNSAERLPNPWRLQFIIQEAFDNYSGLYFHIRIPSPEVAQEFSKNYKEPMYIGSLDDLRREWNFKKVSDSTSVARILGIYASVIDSQIRTQIKEILCKNPAASKSPKEFIEAIKKDSISALEQNNTDDFTEGSEVYKRLRTTQMIQQLTEFLYLFTNTYSGDMDMVNHWNKMGFVVNTTREINNISISAQVESERPRYDGQSFRDYFYYLMNFQDYPDFAPQAKHITNEILNSAQVLIDETGIFDSDHPESFVEYSRESFYAKTDQIYEILRQQAHTSLGWQTSRTQGEFIRRILDSAPFNQTDGAWLRYVANAGPGDPVRALLFEVWSDEIGNGDPALHHGNLFTTLLESLGYNLPPVNSRAYVDNPDLHDKNFIGAVFQLAISLHSEEFFPEILGMTLFLEWEVLSLVPGIKGREYLGIDPEFWQMHVGIDNATNGHGAKARQAIEIYLDGILKESGSEAMQAEWKRIWRGFVAFATAGYNYYQNINSQNDTDITISRRHPGTPQDRIMELMQRKGRYGKLNHLDKRLGSNRINDLFDEPSVFVEELANSPWVVPGNINESRLINYLTTFDGPMYKVFNDKEINLWKEWITWLGKEGDTSTVKRYLSKADSMLILLSELRELAKASGGHRMYKLNVKEENSEGKTDINRMPIAHFFQQGDLKQLMKALADPINGWVVPFDPGNSPIIVDLARVNRPMGAALDRRFASVGNHIGRQVVIRWIEAGCPIPGETAPPRSSTKTQPKWEGRQVFVQQLGMGAVH